MDNIQKFYVPSPPEEVIELNRELEVEKATAQAYLDMYNSLQEQYVKLTHKYGELQQDYENSSYEIDRLNREMVRLRS